MVRKQALLVLGVCCLAVGSYAVAQTTAGGADAEMMAMQKMMMDKDMMMMAKKEMMADESMTMMVAEETLLQQMMMDETFMTSFHSGMMMESDPAQMKMMAEKVAMAKAKMMKDKKTMDMLMKKLMLRTMVADQLGMMAKKSSLLGE